MSVINNGDEQKMLENTFTKALEFIQTELDNLKKS